MIASPPIKILLTSILQELIKSPGFMISIILTVILPIAVCLILVKKSAKRLYAIGVPVIVFIIGCAVVSLIFLERLTRYSGNVGP
jgi:hypothetical protein